MTEVVNRQAGEISVVSQQERAAVARLTTAITALTEAVDLMPINEVASLKGEMATIQTATKELGMSKEAQELSAEAVRRAEWALGRAVKRGQVDGTVRKSADSLRQNRLNQMEERDLESPDAFTQAGRERDDIYRIADLEPNDFEAVLADAKAEGNLSRTNFARKSREKSGRAPEPAPIGSTERAHQEAELINAFGSIVRRSLTPTHVATLSPRARARLISILNEALNTLKETAS